MARAGTEDIHDDDEVGGGGAAPSPDWWRRLLDYDAWANRQYAVALHELMADQPGRDVPLRAMAIFAHLLASHRRWQKRLLGESLYPPSWPSPRPARFVEDVEALRADWDEVMARVEPTQIVHYVNGAGRPAQSSAQDILMHLVLHAGFHRGQIAMLLGRCNTAPPPTDFLIASRRILAGAPALS